jgi:hypothetical protein
MSRSTKKMNGVRRSPPVNAAPELPPTPTAALPLVPKTSVPFTLTFKIRDVESAQAWVFG